MSRVIHLHLPLAVTITRTLCTLTLCTGRKLVLKCNGAVTIADGKLIEGVALLANDQVAESDERDIALAIARAGGVSLSSLNARSILPSRIVSFTVTDHVCLSLASGRVVYFEKTGAKTLDGSRLTKGYPALTEEIECIEQDGVKLYYCNESWQRKAIA